MQIFYNDLQDLLPQLGIFRYISKYYTVTKGSAAFETLQAPIPHITLYYICIHKLITFVSLLHLKDPLRRNLLGNSLILSRSNTNNR